MTLVSREDLRALKEQASPPCVSLYLPTFRGGVEVQQSPIRLKNLLRQTEEQLEAVGNGHRGKGHALLDEARRLVDDMAFWQRQSDGLALFLAPGVFRTFSVPVSFPELALVGDRFHVAPLLRLLEGDGPFHVLALSQKSVRLFEATRHTIEECDLGDVPRSVQEALRYDETEHSLQFHSVPSTPQTVGSRGRGGAGSQAVHTGRRQGMFHGHGVVDDDAKAQVQRFIQVLDDALVAKLRNRPLPLVVAAVDYELAMYRQYSKHPKLVPGGVEGNPQLLSADELRELAWREVRPVFLEEIKRDARRYHDLQGSARASGELDEVLAAAVDGRVEALFVDTTDHRWGRFDAAGRKVEVHEDRKPGDEDLVDRAAFEVLFHGGTVHALEAHTPSGGPVAALYRY
jgi:hypothetical protein